MKINNIDLDSLISDFNREMYKYSETQQEMIKDYFQFMFEYLSLFNIFSLKWRIKKLFNKEVEKLKKKHNLAKTDIKALNLMKFKFKDVEINIVDYSLVYLFILGMKDESSNYKGLEKMLKDKELGFILKNYLIK